MTSLVVGVLLVIGGAAAGVAWDRARLRRWMRADDAGLSPGEAGAAPDPSRRDRMSARSAVEAANRRRQLAEADQRSADTATRRLEASLDAVRSGFVLCDRNGREVARNTAASAFLHARHGEALVARVIKDLLEKARGGEQAATSVELHTEPRRSYDVEAVPITHQGEILGAVALVHDTTEHQRIESVRRDFVANVSHELKTPIGALSLLADSLAADPAPEVATRLSGRMQIEVQRVADTIDGLLTLAMLEDDSGRGDERVDIGAVVDRAADRILETAEQRQVEVVASSRRYLPTVRGSQRHLESALFNLLDNAVKFSEPGGRVDVVVEADERALRVSVADTGIGIPAAERDRIFERFYRVDRTRNRDTGGTGLGLSIVRHIVLNHGGEVSVTSREGYGAQFTITLPLTE